jgi:hypothetical protein
MTSSGIKRVAFRLVTEYLNQLRYRVPSSQYCIDLYDVFQQRITLWRVLCKFSFALFISDKSLMHRTRIVTCRVVRATKITDSTSGDWIYYHLGYK